MDCLEFEDANNAVQARIDAGEEGLQSGQSHSRLLMGITKASLATDSLAVRGFLPGDHHAC